MTAARSKGTARPQKSANDGTLVEALQLGTVAMAFEIKGGGLQLSVSCKVL